MSEQRAMLEGARVLVVEDEYFIADDLARALRNAGAEPVGPVGTIEQARELIRTERVDAAILDLNLHGAMASGLVQRLEEDQVPFLIVSGYSHSAFPPSANDHVRIEKPVDSGLVAKKLADLLGQGPDRRLKIS